MKSLTNGSSRSPTSSASTSASSSACPRYRNGEDPNCPSTAKDFGISIGFMFAIFVGSCLLFGVLCLGWLLCCCAFRQASKGIRRSRQKIVEIKKRRRERRDQRQVEADIERAAPDKRDDATKTGKLRQKDGMEGETTPIEKDSRWARVKSWFGGLVWRPRMKPEKDLEQDGMEMKETQKTIQIDSDAEDDETVVVVQEGPGGGSVQTWSPI